MNTGTKKSLKTRACWNCAIETADLLFCSSCKALQALPEDMDYFDCLGLGIRLQIDLEQLEETFHDLSRKFHPDFYQRRSQEEKQISLENAAILNRAYQTLKDPFKRITYLIGLAEGKRDIPTEAPADLFDEIFALQEELENAKSIPPEDSALKSTLFSKLERAKERFQRRQKESQQQLEVLSAQWDMLEASRKDPCFTSEQMARLRDMKKILSHQAYLERIVNDIRKTIEGR